jgi:cytochrome P450
VFWSPRRSAWIVICHDAAIEVISRAEDFSVAAYDESRPSPLPIPSSFELDADSNRRLQLAVSSCIGRRNLPKETIESGCSDAALSIPFGEPIEFAGSVAESLAMNLIKKWFGLDSESLASTLALYQFASREPDSARKKAAQRLIIRQMLGNITRQRQTPTGNLLSLLARAWEDYHLDDEWLVAFLAPMFSSLAAGFGARLVTHTALHLAENPEYQRVIGEQGWQASRLAALEAARLDPVNQALPRRAKADAKLRGQSIKSGDLLWVAIPAVCRDPETFSEAHSFMPGRPERHLAFGHGPHVCTGRELALAVAATAINELVLHRGARLAFAIGAEPVFEYDLGRSCLRLPLVLSS